MSKTIQHGHILSLVEAGVFPAIVTFLGVNEMLLLNGIQNENEFVVVNARGSDVVDCIMIHTPCLSLARRSSGYWAVIFLSSIHLLVMVWALHPRLFAELPNYVALFAHARLDLFEMILWIGTVVGKSHGASGGGRLGIHFISLGNLGNRPLVRFKVHFVIGQIHQVGLMALVDFCCLG